VVWYPQSGNMLLKVKVHRKPQNNFRYFMVIFPIWETGQKLWMKASGGLLMSVKKVSKKAK